MKSTKKIVVGVAISLIILTGAVVWSCQTHDSEEIAIQESTEASTYSNQSSTRSAGKKVFNKSVGAPISKEKAMAWMTNYESKNARSANGVKSHFFGTDVFERLLKQKEVVGISIFYAQNDDGVPQLLLVGVDEDGNLLTNQGQEGFIDVSSICPPDCSSDKY